MTIAPTPEALSEAVATVIAGAETLAGDYAIVLFDSTYPPARNPDRPTIVRPTVTGDPDHVPGDRWDPGVGSEAGRKACARAAECALNARRLVEQAAAAMAGRTLAVRYRRPPRGAEFRRSVMGTARLLAWLADHDVAHAPDGVRLLVASAVEQLVEAHAAVRTQLRDFERVGEAPASLRCWNCQRPAVYVRTGECEACSRHRRRAEARIRAGQRVAHRVRSVPRFADAHDARLRREARLLPGQLDVEGVLPRGRVTS